MWDTSIAICVCTFYGHTNVHDCVAWSPDGSLLATASHDGTARLWDAATGCVRRLFCNDSDGVFSVAWRPDGDMLCTGLDHMTARLWNVATGVVVHVLRDHT